MDNVKTPPSDFPKKSGRDPGTILVVDDNDRTRRYTTALLKRFGYNAVMASSGRKALAIMADVLPDLIITGTTVDRKSGNEFMEELRRNPTAGRIPFIPVLSPDDPDESRRAYGLGALECLYLPITPEYLYRVIQKHIEIMPRTNIRIQTDLPVKLLESPGSLDVVTATVISISEHGMFVRMQEPYRVGTRLTCRIDLRGQEIIADTKVIYNFRKKEYTSGESGIGLEFVTIFGQGWAIVRQFIRDEITSGARLSLPGDLLRILVIALFMSYFSIGL